MKMKPRFPLSQVRTLAARYEYEDDSEVVGLGLRARKRGHFTKAELTSICYWKSSRSAPLVESNHALDVQELTKLALSARRERSRIEIPQILRGVSWPTASVLLHFGHKQKYPILDFRALWSLGVDGEPRYDFDLWWAYVVACRKAAKSARVDLRTLDRALWQYSKERQ